MIVSFQNFLYFLKKFLLSQQATWFQIMQIICAILFLFFGNNIGCFATAVVACEYSVSMFKTQMRRDAVEMLMGAIQQDYR